MRLAKFIGMGFFIYLCSGWAESSSYSAPPSTHAIREHVAFLSSDALEGRLTGSKGEIIATEYAANFFHRLGLEPAGLNGTFFQEYNFVSGVSLGKHNVVSITYPNGVISQLELEKDWRPLSFSHYQAFRSADLVFAGYGITAPATAHFAAYDAYQGLNVKNKWVLVFRYVPEKLSAERRLQLAPYSSLRYKAFTAKEKGARGIIFVSGPNSKVKNELIPLSLDASLAHSALVAISVNDAVVDRFLQAHAPFNSLQKIQDKLDTGLPNIPVDLTGIRLSGRIDIHQKSQRGRNVLARLRMGKGSMPTLIMGAHVDHLGRGELSGSRSREDELNRIHTGADDNASGVASVFAAAAKLAAMKAHGQLQGNKDILFVIWSGEELGLLGSSHFVKRTLQETRNKALRPGIEAYINLDMVGRLRKNLILQGVGSSLSWPALLKRANQQTRLSLLLQNDPYLPTDSTSFYLHGVPAINLFTGSHDEYHTPRDKAAMLNFTGLMTISQFLVDLIVALEDKPNLIDYQKVKKTSGQASRSFRVYLGTIPDYASADLDGVKLSGVTKDSPAELAGLKQDDVIIELAGKKIRNIYDYTFVLNTLQAGETATLTVMRGTKKVVLKVVARARE